MGSWSTLAGERWCWGRVATGPAGAVAIALAIGPLLWTLPTAAQADEAAQATAPVPIPAATSSRAAAPKPAAGGHDAAAIGKALANPVSNVWALFTEFDFTFHDGDIPGSGSQVTYSALFQPVLPIPLTENWKLITRPTIPIIWSTPFPTLELAPSPSIDFVNKTGLGDTLLPIVPAPNEGLKFGPGELVGGVGPTFGFPTSTDDRLGSQKWQVGAAAIAVYKTDKITVGAFPQYWWSVGNRKHGKSRPKTSHGSFLYFFFYELGDAWQIGFNPSITYNHEAPKNNKWNVPVGLTLAKTFVFGKQPVKIQIGGEYSVVRQDLYAKQWLFKVNIIPVIPGLIKKPLF